MQIFYHKTISGNFGDDLNGWIWPKIFPEINEKASDVIFVGFETIFDNRLNIFKKRIVVFGTGIRSISNLPVIDKKWKIRFLRGPISSLVLKSLRGLNCRYITDSSYCLGTLKFSEQKKKHDFGFIPHFTTANIYNCKKISAHAGLLYIDPREEVETILNKIRSCKAVISEAMHGAIVADVFRIPWIRVNIHSWRVETIEVSAFKWLDWGLSMGVDTSPVYLRSVPFYPNTGLKSIPFMLLKNYFLKAIADRLIAIKHDGHKFRLTQECSYYNTIEKLEEEISSLRDEFF